jgi:hypothetical protein
MILQFIFVSIVRMIEHPVESILEYRFSSRDLLNEALLAAGASTLSKDIHGDVQGINFCPPRDCSRAMVWL